MDTKKIKQLAQIVRENGLTLLEVEQGDSKVRLERILDSASGAMSKAKTVVAADELTEKIPLSVDLETIANKKEVDFNDTREIKSPMVGVFYSSQAPDAPPFVSVGDKIKKGDTLCIIEAMKIMNEITAETDGEVVDISAQNGEIVEFGQVLFKIF